MKVNGKIVKELGTKVTPQDKVEVNNIPLEKKNLFILLYKPTGVISSVSDDKGRSVVTDFFRKLHNVYSQSDA